MDLQCPNCPGVGLEQSHTAIATPDTKTMRAECPQCLTVFTECKFVVAEASLRGTGHKAVARAIAEGRLVPKLVEGPNAVQGL